MVERVISYGGHFGKIFNPGSMDVYLAKIFIIRYVIILAGLIATLQMLDLLAKSEEVLAGEGAVYADLWRYVTLRSPHLISLFSPFVALLASILTLSVLNVNSEIVIMKAAGWSAFRILMPLMAVSLLVSVISFVFSETVTVQARAELRNWEANAFAADIPPAPDSVFDTWVTDGQNLVKAESASRNGSILLLDEVTQYIRDENKTITNIIKADFAVYRDDAWKLFEVKTFDVNTLEITVMENLDWETTIPPERFISLAIVADQVNMPRLRRAITQLKSEGHDTDSLDTMLHQKYVSPLSTLLMPLLAGLAAFGLHRGGNLFGRILITLSMGFGFFVVNNLFIALGQYGAVPPLIAAWLPFLLFGLAGVSFILLTEE
ncbi:LPS export ABC transporter permease LptG [Pseudemcibacter aquimaris]|uniref:LPS export ABC transporter permease LptG n=1 Tax=Pseudemcibacter aquimaris TaxID=2857064 RepID=UPI00201178C7|nr:LPS export ABC transporter permease LptG [Pseudemcibacter aquimaris]MCC3860637.1 LPS export ABC transporter permease LptG [Pseudemcibacter aquimaris]WDU59456.1 LPS export ABC transporter permease LptG [Pseudemcibacter aquimaris]